jgi:hypothetical protein
VPVLVLVPVLVPVLVRGDGVACASAVHLLRRDGFATTGGDAVARAAPVLLLSEAALALLRDVFGQADLLAGHTPVTQRVVAWGGAEPVAMPHSGIVVTGAELAAQLPPRHSAPAQGEPFFTIHGAAPYPDAVVRRFGRREAMAAAVELAPGADGAACHVEATAGGWLFLIPCGDGQAWLLGVGDTLDALLGQSRLVAARIATLGPTVARFETAPRMLETLAGEGWLACGTGAIAFDPICGDGTAQAVREGILAAAVIAGIREGDDDSAALIDHYQSMLLAAMRRHLQISLPFYRGGGTSPWWREQAEAVAGGYAWCTARLAAMPEPRFVLRGARLVRREAVA